MDFNILGPLEVRDPEGRVIGLPGGRERALLAFLLIPKRGEVVSTDRIVDALWGEHAPGTAAKAVQGYISHLCRQLVLRWQKGDALTISLSPGRPATRCAATR